MAPPQLDTFGRVVTEAPPDMYTARCGIAMAINRLAAFFPAGQIERLFGFFVGKSLGDRNAEVRGEMLKAAVSTVNEHGKVLYNTLLVIIDYKLAGAGRG